LQYILEIGVYKKLELIVWAFQANYLLAESVKSPVIFHIINFPSSAPDAKKPGPQLSKDHTLPLWHTELESNLTSSVIVPLRILILPSNKPMIIN
jgi:hypothetical protein